MSVGARFEWFKDTKGSRTGVPNDPSYINFTITPGYTFDGALTVRAEFRYDTCSEAALGVPTKAPEKNQSTIAIGAHYVF
jgi:long-subunit fatty acid transport protein